MQRKGVGRPGVAVVSALVAAVIGLSGALSSASSSTVVPKAGTWKVKVVKGGGSGAAGNFTVTRGSFGVSTTHKRVVHFSFSYTYSGPIKPPSGSCSGNGVSTAAESSAITRARFATPSSTSWSGAGSATFHGVFTSARRAHGTAIFSVFISGAGCQFSGTAKSGTASWTATR